MHILLGDAGARCDINALGIHLFGLALATAAMMESALVGQLLLSR